MFDVKDSEPFDTDEDDFDTVVPDMSNYIAERVPNSDFTCTAHFLNEVGGEGIGLCSLLGFLIILFIVR